MKNNTFNSSVEVKSRRSVEILLEYEGYSFLVTLVRYWYMKHIESDQRRHQEPRANVELNNSILPDTSLLVVRRTATGLRGLAKSLLSRLLYRGPCARVGLIYGSEQVSSAF